MWVNILPLVGAAIFSAIAVRVMTMRWRHQPKACWEEERMVLSQPRIRRYLAVLILALCPLALRHARSSREPGLGLGHLLVCRLRFRRRLLLGRCGKDVCHFTPGHRGSWPMETLGAVAAGGES